MRWRQSVRSLALVSGLALGVPIALGQNGAPPAESAVTEKPASEQDRTSVTAMRIDHLARTIARIAMFDLRSISSPTESDQRIAEILLSMSCDLLPDDEDMLRRRMEAAYGAGDEASVLDLSRKLLQLDPQDAVTQLRLITAAIGRQNQTVESRLAAYKRFIDDKRFDEAVRSRLALDAALLTREQGNERGFRDNLETALRLDPTNKEAAYTLFVFLDSRTTNPANRIDLLGYLLMADPLDPNTHMALAREFAFNGAFKAARRFHGIATQIRVQGGESWSQAAIEEAVLLWHTDGPAATVASLTQLLNQSRADAMTELQRRKDRKLPLDDAKKPEDVRLPEEFSELMLHAALAAKDQVAIASTSKSLLDNLKATVESLRDPLRRGRIDEAQAAKITTASTIAIEIVRLLSNVEVKAVGEDLAAMPDLATTHPKQVETFRGWIQLREGKYEEAIETFRPLVTENPIAEFGSAYAQELAGHTSEAIAEYRAIVRRAPLESLSAWARTNARALGDVEESSVTKELQAKADAIPSDYDRMPVNPRDFLLVRAELSQDGPQCTDRLWVTITVQNLSRFALGVGTDRPISSKFLLAPTIESTSMKLEKLVRPEVTDLSRRLRLLPREKMEFKVWPDAGQTGWIVEALANRSVRLRWIAIQDFVTEAKGGYRPGVFALSTETKGTVRKPPPECIFDPATLGTRILEDTPESLPRLAAAARSLVLRPLLLSPQAGEPAGHALSTPKPGDPEMPSRGELDVTPEMLKPIADAFAARYPQLAPQIRAHLIAVLPSALLAPGMEAFDAIVKTETDPVALAMVLVTRVTKADDPLLASAEQHTDDRVRTLATALRSRLSRDETSVARMTPDDVRKMRDGNPRMTPAMADKAAKMAKPLTTPGDPEDTGSSSVPDLNK